MESNRDNLFNGLKGTNIVGGKLLGKVCGKLQMISQHQAYESTEKVASQ